MATYVILRRFSTEAFRTPKEFKKLAYEQKEEKDEEDDEEEEEEEEEEEKEEEEDEEESWQ